ncbi:MAG: hypothetical protein ACRD12_20115 [Acidimicrobiales bacterium]
MADFRAGTRDVPQVPDIVARSLTETVDGAWVVWAHKVARSAGVEPGLFMPLTRGMPYPADAIAECRNMPGHDAPQRRCKCGFHAVSHPLPAGGLAGLVHLQVALSGRILAFELPSSPLPQRPGAAAFPTADWPMDALLFRASRQTVVRVDGHDSPPPPDDPEGRLVVVSGRQPRGAGPCRLRLPLAPPPVVTVTDDVGACRLAGRPDVDAVLAPA